MAETTPTSYDAVPYFSQAFPEVHPDRLAVIATLHGMTPPAVERCRVLELGCAGAGNLAPIAQAIPDGQFVGIDLSPRQIEQGRELVGRLGLRNIELRALSIADIGEDLGRFDYILCHGVYSWVPEPIRGAILEVVRRHLAPDGVALVSYNTYPGWHLRGVARDLMLYHVRSIDDPDERARKAREVLEAIASSSPDRDTPYIQSLLQESARLRGERDSYVLHEHLEDENRALYFHEFVERAAAHRLQVVGDARHRGDADAQPPPIADLLAGLADDWVRREQYHDFLRNRTFRRTLLCHEGVSLTRPPSPESVATLRVLAQVGPPDPNPDIASNAPVEFRPLQGGKPATASTPLVKAALTALSERWPLSASFEELRMLTYAKLARASGPGSPPIDRDPRALGSALVQAYAPGVVDLHAFDPGFTVQVGEHPRASPIAALQAEQGRRVVNVRHRLVELSDFDRLVLRHLDGDRDFYALLDALEEAIQAGEFTIYQDSRPLTDRLRLRQVLGNSIEPSLRRLASSALLVA